MAAQTGRTVSKWTSFVIDDSGGTLRTIPVNTINGVSLTYSELDLTAWMDALHGALPEQPDCVVSIGGPFDTTAVAAAGTLSGSHTVLSAIVGLNTPLTMDVQVGIRHAWEYGEPQFGITSTAANGFLCRSYDVDLSSMQYTATFGMFPGSAAPAWGTTAET